MKPEYPLPVRYVLYTHYPEGNDWKEYLAEWDLRQTPPPVDKLDGVQFLIRHLSGLRGLLTWPGHEGLLIVFYSPGLNECLTGITNRESLAKLKTYKELKFAQAVHNHIDGVMTKEYKELLPRLRFFTALDLYAVFGRIRNSGIVDRLRTWMIGDETRLTYDSPKIIEAIVRLRLLGSGVPVFRVDYDVLLRGEENWDKKNLEFSSTIGSCLMAYQLRRDSPNLSSFIFSASYDHKILNEPDASDNFHKWGRAYATRVFPSLCVDKLKITKTVKTIETLCKKARRANAQPVGKKEREITAHEWDCYATETFRSELASKFFGFDEKRRVSYELDGIAEIGAHPMASVISGAMLYLSDGAILDLPPFSNFSQNVSWVDDHLKYCLHRELRHLRRPNSDDNGVREPKRRDLLTYSKLDDVVVQKAGRKIDTDLRKYIFDGYLPTLLRGTILDAWITPDPRLKYRPEELTEEDYEVQSQLLSQQCSAGLLPSALQQALAACTLTTDARNNLERELELVALKRISQVRRQWGSLTDGQVETFASIWAKGRAESCCRGLELKYPGIVRNRNLGLDVDLAAEHLSFRVSKDLSKLIEDACDYIEWTRQWPIIVQVVRSVEQGTLRTDLNYDVESSDLSQGSTDQLLHPDWHLRPASRT